MNQQITREFWNQTRVEQLKNLWNTGLSAAEISQKIGGSRCAILGKAHRLGLSKPNYKFWTQANTDRLVALWAEGFSAATIKGAIGATSKSAILNKAEKLGLKARTQTQIIRTNSSVRRQPRLNINLKNIPTPNQQFKCTLMELVNDTCRWPLWNESNEPKFYCGTPEADCANGKPYCRWHTARSRRQSEVSLEALA